MMYSKDSENYFAITPGTLISEVMENKGLSSHEVAEQIHLSDQEFSELLKGDFDLDDVTIDALSKALGISVSLLNTFYDKYQEDLEIVNQENAALILEPA
ncbi:MAG: helix-turn-helix domain-containing protein [Flexilinea sp.]|nr:helix-turn-helix domain-containing protein [Flexilinea sp.]